MTWRGGSPRASPSCRSYCAEDRVTRQEAKNSLCCKAELAFVVEDHRTLGGGYAALAILIGNLRWHRDRDARRGAKLSLVRGLQWRRHGRRRHELWVHNISTMPGDCSWDWRLLRAEYAIPAPTGPASKDPNALSTLNGRS